MRGLGFAVGADAAVAQAAAGGVDPGGDAQAQACAIPRSRAGQVALPRPQRTPRRGPHIAGVLFEGLEVPC